MATLSEVELAVEALPRQEQEVLLSRLKLRLRDAASSGWPVAPPNVAPEEISRVQALIDEEFSRSGEGE